MAKDSIVRKIFREDDLSNFEDFFDRNWFENVSGLVENTKIEKIVGNFAVSWWGNARAFILPWLLVTGVSDVITESAPIRLEIPTQRVWNEYLKHPEFNVALWKLSENVYCSTYFAYENLIVDVLKEILGTPIRVTHKRDFKTKLKDVYGNECTRRIWHQTFVYAARETRNSIVHNGGRATSTLLNVKPLPHYIQGDEVVLLIFRSVCREAAANFWAQVFFLAPRAPGKTIFVLTFK